MAEEVVATEEAVEVTLTAEAEEELTNGRDIEGELDHE
jgi:hypothetical protein